MLSFRMIKRLFKYIIPSEANDYVSPLLSHVMLVVYTLTLLLFHATGSISHTSYVSSAYASSITPANIISLTNRERTNAGLNALQTNSLLNISAANKAQHMCDNDYWAHDAPDGTKWYTFIYATGYGGEVGENLAKGFSTAEGVVQAWMGSAAHRANILKGSYTEIGVAVKSCTLQGESTILVVQHFGARDLTPPPPPPADTSTSPQPSTSQPSQQAPARSNVVYQQKPNSIEEITITEPETRSISNNPLLPIKGEVVFRDSAKPFKYEIRLFVADISNSDTSPQWSPVGESVSDTPGWEFVPTEPWKDGEYHLEARLPVDGENRVAEVEFAIDTKSPEINLAMMDINVSLRKSDADMASISEDDSVKMDLMPSQQLQLIAEPENPEKDTMQSDAESDSCVTDCTKYPLNAAVWKITIPDAAISEEAEAQLYVNDEKFTFTSPSENDTVMETTFTLQGPLSEKQFLLVVTDAAGNESKYDITDQIQSAVLGSLKEDDSQDEETFLMGVLNNDTSMGTQTIRTILLATFLGYMLILFASHAYIYFHLHHAPHHGSGYLFSFVLILLLTAISVANNFNLGGTIL